MARFSLVVAACALTGTAAFAPAAARLHVARAAPLGAKLGFGPSETATVFENERATANARVRPHDQPALRRRRDPREGGPEDDPDDGASTGRGPSARASARSLTSRLRARALFARAASPRRACSPSSTRRGFGLRDIEPLLYVIEDSGLVGATGELAAPILPFLPQLASTSRRRSSAPRSARCQRAEPRVRAARGGLGGRGVRITSLPDTDVLAVAAQTAGGIVFGAVTPALFLVLAAVTSKPGR